ncbi:MAG: hypothetical protein QF701_09290, partial [Nitrospinota bacterium]|nr:hypothetical protein [Nitrospinota bacterium]
GRQEPMAMSPKGQQLYNEVLEARGFVYPAFALLCETAPEMLEKYEDMKNHLMNSDGPFPERTRTRAQDSGH